MSTADMAFIGSGWHALRAQDGFTLFRGCCLQEPDSCLLLAADSEFESPHKLARLEHEYSLSVELQPGWAALPLHLVHVQRRLGLIYRDPGGQLLTSLIGEPCEIGLFLRIGSALAEAVADMHAAGFVHRDLKPDNVFYEPRSGQVRLIGFGIASRNTRERSAIESPEAIAGSLRYVSPEQTGRMNRSVDTRSDLYSLGVSLYELLTGELPFVASDPMQLVHSHIARRPVPPSQKTAVPEPLSQIVMRLLAKTAEDRYQTASGVAFDLCRCREEWEESHHIQDFALAANDKSARLVVPEKLYGRAGEVDRLLAAFDDVVTGGQGGVTLIAGGSGVGKSTLVKELHKALLPSHALFASGKFDQFKRDLPYATVGQAFQSLLGSILSQSNEGLEHWRHLLQEALGASGQLMVNVVPELELVIGRQPPVPELAATDAVIRFQRVFKRFLGVFAQPEHPLVLFLDDLQWADPATLALLGHLSTSADMNHLMLIGAYRDNEVHSAHPLASALTVIRAQCPGRLVEIELQPLDVADVGDFLAGALQEPAAAVADLAHLVHQKTDGNPFFVVQFLTALVDHGLMTFHTASAAWTWELDSIRAQSHGENVLALMVGKLNRLGDDTRKAVVQLACLGGSVEVSTMEAICKSLNIASHSPLGEAVDAGLVLASAGAFRFVHDRVQEAAYALTPVSDREAIHLHLGRFLVSYVMQEKLQDAVFDIASQYERGSALITTSAERMEVAGLFLLAGQRARASTAFPAARKYLSAGTHLLLADAWERDYPLAFRLGVLLAECEFLTGDLEAAEVRLMDLALRATGLVDRAAVAWLRVTLNTAMDRMDLAIDVALSFLKTAGIDWTPVPEKTEAQAEYDALLLRIACGSINALTQLPILIDPQQRAIQDVLTAALPPAFFSNANLVCLILCRMANLSVDHGNSDASPLAYAYLGMVVGPHFGDYKIASQFGQLGMELVDRKGLDRYRGRVYHTVGSHVMPWTAQLRDAAPLLRRAFDAAKEAGDVTYGGFSSCTLITNRLGAGDALAEVEAEADVKLEFVRTAKFGLIVDIITAQLCLIHSLRGKLRDFASFDGPDFQETAFEHRLASNKGLAIAECWYWIRKMQCRYFAGEWAAAVVAADRAEALIWTSSGHFEWAEFHFYAALARASWYDNAPSPARPGLLAAIVQHQQQLTTWDATSPDTFGSRVALVSAELARLQDSPLAAMQSYEMAIQGARVHGFVQNEALACEVAARFHASQGLHAVAHALLLNARLSYQRWGAFGKAHQLARLHPELLHAAPVAGSATSPSAQLENFDLETVVRTSQAVSGQVGLPRLIHTLMVIALEHAGAQRGLLILPRHHILRIEAEASVGSDGVKVRMRQDPVSAVELPESLLHYVIRTRQSVLLDDALVPNEFSADDYIIHSRPRSVLCLPLVKQDELIGMIYLENKLAAGVFTAGRTDVLRLLASTAAVSVENASLEEKESLLKEVHHRVKNNLQLISSLLSLQAGRIQDPDVAELFAESRNRVRSMALVHENLYRAGNFARVPMGEHVQSLCAQLARAYGLDGQRIHLVVRLEDVQLDLDRAISCGLIVNELVSNAIKHAFPGEHGGEIRVELKIEGKHRFALSVADNGVGLPGDFDPLRADSLGLQLIADLTQQLDGVLEVGRESGCSFTVTFDATGQSMEDV